MKITSLAYSRSEDDPKHRKNPDAVRPAPSPLGLAALSAGGGGSSGGSSITINNTNGTVPYRTGATTFADSPLTVNAPAGTGIAITSAAAGSGVTVGVTGSGNNNLNLTTTGTGIVDVIQGDLRLYDQTAVTGITSLVLRNGAGQSINNHLLSLQNASGTEIAFFGDVNGLITLRSTNIQNASAVSLEGSSLRLGGTIPILWSNTANYYDTSDFGIVRSGVGVGRLTNASTGAGQLLIGTSTDTADAQLSVYSQSTTRPGLKLRALSGTAGSQNVFESFDSGGTLTASIASDGTITGTSLTTRLGTTYIGWAGRSTLRSSADGKITLLNQAENNFTSLLFGGTTSSFPSLTRSSTSIAVRLADDSDDAPLTVLTVKTKALTVATLPAAATVGAGARAFVTDANATTFLSTVAGGGANNVPVVSDGTNWLIG